MAPGVNSPLYTTELLRLAASLGDPHPLMRADGCSEVRSPTCGSRIRMVVQLDRDRRVEALSMEVHACAFGQASAALVEQHSHGRSADELIEAMADVTRWLVGENDRPAGWPGLEVLDAARTRTGRHGAILLPFRALLGAIEAAP